MGDIDAEDIRDFEESGHKMNDVFTVLREYRLRADRYRRGRRRGNCFRETLAKDTGRIFFDVLELKS